MIDLPTDSVYKLMAIFGGVLIFYGLFNAYNSQDNLEQMRFELEELRGKYDSQLARVQTVSGNAKRAYRRICRIMDVPNEFCIYTANETEFYDPVIIEEIEFAILKQEAGNETFEAGIYAEHIKKDGEVKRYEDHISLIIHKSMFTKAIEEYKTTLKEHRDKWWEYNIARQEINGKIEHKVTLVAHYEEKFKWLYFLNVGILIAGGLLSAIGFFLWYHKIQKFEDIRIRNVNE